MHLFFSITSLIKILAPKRTIDEEKVMRNIKELGSFNVADDMKDSNQLLPRFHLKALSYLIEQGIFVENAKTKAIALRDRLEREMGKTKDGNLKKKETKKEKWNMKKSRCHCMLHLTK